MPEHQNVEYEQSWHDEYLQDGGFLVTLFKATPNRQQLVTGEVAGEVARLLSIMKGDMLRTEIQELLGLKGQGNFRTLYLVPALKSGLIEMTIPGKSTSRFQKYRLTEKGRKLLPFKDGSA